MMRWMVLVWMVAAGLLQAAESGFFVRTDPRLTLKSAAVGEASGLAISQRDASLMWLVNDSGAAPILYLAGIDGVERGQVLVDGANNVDWEDVSSFQLDGLPYLLIADAGDNASKRQDAKLYIVPEPAAPEDGLPLAGVVKAAWTISFGFEDGPRDCEAVAVDAKAGKVILVSKRTKPPLVYELPLKPKGGGVAVARKIGETSVLPPPNFRMIPYSAQPTGLTISADSSMAAIVTYYGVFLFRREGKEGWGDALAKPGVDLGAHGLGQAESIGFSKDGKLLSVVAEGAGSPIIRYQR